jgi:nicotinamidase-related amidase
VKTALIVVDMRNRYDHSGADSLMESVRDSLPAMRRLIDAARERDILTVYVNDNRGDWSANAATRFEDALRRPDRALVEPIVPAGVRGCRAASDGDQPARAAGSGGRTRVRGVEC